MVGRAPSRPTPRLTVCLDPKGGARLFRSLLDAGLVDRAVLYYGPLLAGGTGAPLFRGHWNTLEDARPVRNYSL